MKIFKRLLLVFLFILTGAGILTLSSCNAEDVVQHNLLKDTGNFKTYRTITVINLRSGERLMEFEGYLTSKLDEEKDLNIMIKVGPDQYQLHYVRLAPEITYLSQQLDVTPSSPYYYKVSIFAPYPVVSNPE